MRWIVANIKWVMLVSGALIALVGAMLVYGAFVPVVRPPVLDQQAGVAVAFDLAMVSLYAWHLLAIRISGRP
jgi:hypothetical protein